MFVIVIALSEDNWSTTYSLANLIALNFFFIRGFTCLIVNEVEIGINFIVYR